MASIEHSFVEATVVSAFFILYDSSDEEEQVQELAKRQVSRTRYKPKLFRVHIMQLREV
jgi:hypothetical protein